VADNPWFVVVAVAVVFAMGELVVEEDGVRMRKAAVDGFSNED